MKKQIKQILENLPKEILNQPRFFAVNEVKEPLTKGWSKPENQKPYNEIQGLVGFDTAGHDVFEDYLFLDFDHIFNDDGQFVNVLAEEWYTKIRDALKTYCELSASSTGAHMIAKPTKGKFKKISSGKNGRIYFSERRDKNAPFLELFYCTRGRYCLFTGNVFDCEPNAPVTHGQAADDVFTMCLEEITKQNQKPPKTPLKPQEANSAVLVYQSQGNTREYDIWRAGKMLDVIRVAELSREDWLNVGMALKNNGNTCSDWENWSRNDDRFKQNECETLWQGFNGAGLTIATIADLANRYGYDAKAEWKEWCDLHPEFKNQIIHRPEPMNDDDQQEKFSWTQDKIKSCPVNLRLSNDYTFSTNGISLVVETKKGVKYIPVTKTPIVPTKIFREPTKSKFSYEIAILIRGVWRTTEVDGKALADPRAIIGLADTGALIDEPKILCRFLNAMIALNPDMQEVKAYSQTGWIDDTFTTFAYPGNGDCIIRRAGFDFDKTLATRGDAELWKKKFIEVLEKGGAIAHAYFGTALAAVVARPLNIMNPQAHLLGTSGGGKTALQKFTASNFGNPRKLMRNFAATNKNRQLVAAAFCDLPSFYDELETIQGKAAEENLSNDVYNFADGKGNQANKRDGTARETFEFGGARLTTGERPILKQRDQRGAYKRLMQYHIHGKLFDDEFAADLHIFSESNFGHFSLPWIQFATEHMQEIQKAYQHWAKSDPTTRKFEPTHLKTLAASLVAVEFFKVMLGVNSEYDAVSLVRNRRIILDTQLPTLDQMDDTTRAIDFLKSFVAGNDRAFAHEVDKPDFNNEFTQQTPECIGKIFKNGEVAFLPHAFTEILEKRGGFSSADKLREEFCAKGYLRHSEGKTTYPTYFRDKKVRMIRFLPNIITTEELTKLENNASAN